MIFDNLREFNLVNFLADLNLNMWLSDGFWLLFLFENYENLHIKEYWNI